MRALGPEGEGQEKLRRQEREPSDGKGRCWGDRRTRLTWDGAELTAQPSGSQHRMARGYPARRVEGLGVPRTLSPLGLDPSVRMWVLQSPK